MRRQEWKDAPRRASDGPTEDWRDRRPNGELDISGPWGIGLHALGREAMDKILLLLLFGAAFGALGWINWRGFQSLEAQHTSQIEEMRIQTYLQSLPPDHRPRLRAPAEVRDRLEERR